MYGAETKSAFRIPYVANTSSASHEIRCCPAWPLHQLLPPAREPGGPGTAVLSRME